MLTSVPLTALGLATAILGGVSLALGRSMPRLPPEAVPYLLEAGVENMATLLEELGLTCRALYLPSSLYRALASIVSIWIWGLFICHPESRFVGTKGLGYGEI